MSSRHEKIRSIVHADRAAFKKFYRRHVHQTGYDDRHFHFIIVPLTKNNHPFSEKLVPSIDTSKVEAVKTEQIQDEATDVVKSEDVKPMQVVAVNGIVGGTITLKQNRNYFFTFESKDDHVLNFTTRLFGNSDSDKIPTTMKGIQTINFYVGSKMPSTFYYYLSDNTLTGGVITIIDSIPFGIRFISDDTKATEKDTKEQDDGQKHAEKLSKKDEKRIDHEINSLADKIKKQIHDDIKYYSESKDKKNKKATKATKTNDEFPLDFSDDETKGSNHSEAKKKAQEKISEKKDINEFSDSEPEEPSKQDGSKSSQKNGKWESKSSHSEDGVKYRRHEVKENQEVKIPHGKKEKQRSEYYHEVNSHKSSDKPTNNRSKNTTSGSAKNKPYQDEDQDNYGPKSGPMKGFLQRNSPEVVDFDHPMFRHSRHNRKHHH
jgi:hypothetical protein